MAGPFRISFFACVSESGKSVAVDFFRQVAKTLHRPSLIGLSLPLAEAPGTICGEDAETQIDRKQIGERLHIFYAVVNQTAAQQNDVAKLVRQSGNNRKRIVHV